MMWGQITGNIAFNSYCFVLIFVSVCQMQIEGTQKWDSDVSAERLILNQFKVTCTVQAFVGNCV